jgi:hypothetical protein
MYARSSGRTLLFIVQTYEGGTTECMLSQKVQQTYVGPLDVCCFLGYPLGNTWMYETPSGPMYKDHRTYARVVELPLLCQRVGGELSL